MNCIVTAGPTCESLDEVRRLTNFSTGKLGCDLADCLTAKGHRVTLLKGCFAVYPGPSLTGPAVTFTSTADLRQQLQALSSQPFQAIFHAAAVSDFRFGKVFTRLANGDLAEVKAGKFSTSGGCLLAELVPTPKIIADLRDWFPHAQLVGWKFEVDGTQKEAMEAGRRQLQSCRTDACVVNGPAYGQGFGMILQTLPPIHVPNATELYDLLAKWLRPP